MSDANVKGWLAGTFHGIVKWLEVSEDWEESGQLYISFEMDTGEKGELVMSKVSAARRGFL